MTRLSKMVVVAAGHGVNWDEMMIPGATVLVYQGS